MRRIASVALLTALSACGVTVDTFVKPGVDFSQYPRIAVLRVDGCNGDVAAQNSVSDMAGMEMMKRGFDIVERAQLEKILEEQGRQSMDITSDKDRAAIGQIANVKAVIVGNVPHFSKSVSEHLNSTEGYTDNKGKYHPGQTYTVKDENYEVSVTLKMIDVATGSILWQGTGSTTGGQLGIVGNNPLDFAKAIIKQMTKQMPSPTGKNPS